MPKIENVPFEFKNETTATKQVITLSGTIRKRYWDDDRSIDAKLVETALNESNLPLTIRLNTPGGDVFEGIEIYNLLKSSERDITVEVTALAASAGSLVAMGANKIVMLTGSQMMIHEAATFAYGNKSDVQKVLNALETIDESIIDIYATRTGKSREDISDLISKETWFTAEKAVAEGFADEQEAKSDEDSIDEIVDRVLIKVQNKLFNQMEKPEQETKPVQKLKLFGGK